jgi:hypothetical protein
MDQPPRKHRDRDPHPSEPQEKPGDGAERRNPRTPTAEVAARLKKISRQHAAVVDHLSKAEELADGIQQDLRGIQEDLGDLQGQLRPNGAERTGADPNKVRRLKREWDDSRRLLAESGTGEFFMNRLADGSAVVIVEGKEIRLSPTLAALLDILASDRGPGGDHLVAWKTVPEVTDQLTLKLGRVMDRHALRQNILRLRRKLDDAGLNRFLVQTQESRMRFALQRPEAGECAPGRAGHAGR